jgi:TetR/AcrR family transcriptional regulator of autoinduction and epiphytic fitness
VTATRAGTPAMGAEAGIDGRAARAARTRDAVVDALLALLDEGDPRPTARQVAERAGVSLRSVYVRFEDLDALYVEAARRQWERISALAVPVAPDAPLAARRAAFVAQRAEILETAARVRRAAELQEPFSDALAGTLMWARNLARDQVARVFAPELATRRAAASARLLDALDAATGFGTWDVLRRQRGLDPAAARAVVDETVAALLAHTPD